jgi:exopolysaccharide biosynthesis polyprenyl glycosylphosphotransferase
MSRVLNLRKILLFFGDVFLLYFSLFLTVFLGFLDEFDTVIFLDHLLPFSILYSFWLIIFYISGLYDLNIIRTKINLYQRLSLGLFTGFIAGVIFFYLIPFSDLTPKTNLALNVIIFGILFWAWRKLFYFLFSAHLLNKVAILGEKLKVQEISQEISRRPYLGYKLTSIIDRDEDDIESKIQELGIDTLIVAEDLKSNPKVLKSLYRCLSARINFMDFSKAYELICQKIPVNSININWFLENLKEGDKGFYDKLKKMVDLILSVLILIITSPLLPLIALSIKLEDRGPILYKQERVGKDRKPFLLFKFRSMRVDAEKENAIWAEVDDPRVTKTGRFLRKTHLDELPQMINIIKGDISLVGPRPERPEFVQQLEKQIPHYHLRHLIKPGFSGWAQIKFRYGRSVMDSLEKFQYDLYYLKNRSIVLDLGILLKTFQLFFKSDSI